MSNIELIYFSIHGRALLTRMLLKYGGVEFKDTHVDREEFAKMKPSEFEKAMFGQHFKIIFSSSSTWPSSGYEGRWTDVLSVGGD